MADPAGTDTLERLLSDRLMDELAELAREHDAERRRYAMRSWLEQELSPVTRALRQARRDRWQPIESAPKDGTEVLCGWFYPDRRQAHYQVLAYAADWFGEGKGSWVLEWDFNVRFQPDGVHETPPTGDWQPTHWMPLPLAPAPSPEPEE